MQLPSTELLSSSGASRAVMEAVGPELLSPNGDPRAVMQRTRDKWDVSGTGVTKCTEDKLLVCILRVVASRMDRSGDLFHQLCVALNVDPATMSGSEGRNQVLAGTSSPSEAESEEASETHLRNDETSERAHRKPEMSSTLVVRQDCKEDEFPSISLDKMIPEYLAHVDASTCSEFLNGLCNRVLDVVPSLMRRSRPQPTHWKLGRVLGRGAYGECRIAIDQDTGMLFALKTVQVSGSRSEVAELLKSLRQEVLVLTGVQHPNVVQCYGVSLDYGSGDKDGINIAMEYVEGGSLASLLNEFGPLPLKVAATYARQMALGLEYLHARGVAHGDVKPGNTLIDKNGIVKLSDFGSSRLVGVVGAERAGSDGEGGQARLDEQAGSASGFEQMVQHSPKLEVKLRESAQDQGKRAPPKGTPAYMSPEVVRGGKSSSKSDVWALGITVLEMLTGSRGYQNSTPLATMFCIGRGTPPTLPDDLDPCARQMICLSTMADPEARPSATDLLCTRFIEQGRREETAGMESETMAVLLNLMAMISKLQIREPALEPLRRRAKSRIVHQPAQLEELRSPPGSVHSEAVCARGCKPRLCDGPRERAPARVVLEFPSVAAADDSEGRAAQVEELTSPSEASSAGVAAPRFEEAAGASERVGAAASAQVQQVLAASAEEDTLKST